MHKNLFLLTDFRTLDVKALSFDKKKTANAETFRFLDFINSLNAKVAVKVVPQLGASSNCFNAFMTMVSII